MKLNSTNFSDFKNILSLIIILICFLNSFDKIYAQENNDLNDNTIIPPEDLEESIPVADNNSTSIKSYKFLFMYKYHGVQNEPEHKLNLFTHKNILLSNDQLVFFESPNENDPVIVFLKKKRYFIIKDKYTIHDLIIKINSIFFLYLYSLKNLDP